MESSLTALFFLPHPHPPPHGGGGGGGSLSVGTLNEITEHPSVGRHPPPPPPPHPPPHPPPQPPPPPPPPGKRNAWVEMMRTARVTTNL